MSVAVPESAAAARQLPPSMIERMTLILDAFDGPSARLTLEEISRVTHLPRSTAHRIIDQLVQSTWLEHSSCGYALGRRAIALGGGERVHAELRAAAAPVLVDLMLSTGLVVHLGVLAGGDVLYLDKLGGRATAAVPSRVGGTMPAYTTALGKAMLAWVEPEEVDELVGRRLSRRTPNTVASLDALHGELHRIRGRGGLAIERGENHPDIGCVAAAIRGPEGPLGAISLVGQAGTALERVAPLVVNAARSVSVELFGGLQPARRRR